MVMVDNKFSDLCTSATVRRFCLIGTTGKLLQKTTLHFNLFAAAPKWCRIYFRILVIKERKMGMFMST